MVKFDNIWYLNWKYWQNYSHNQKSPELIKCLMLFKILEVEFNYQK